METGLQAPEKPESSWAEAGVPSKSLRRRNFLDRLTRWVVTAGGLAIVASVLGILLFIFLEVLPLLSGASAVDRPAVPLASGTRVLAGGVDEHETAGFAVTEAGRIEYFSLTSDSPPAPIVLASAAGRRLTCASGSSELAMGTADGFVATASHRFEVTYEAAAHTGPPRRIVKPELAEGPLVPLDARQRPVIAVARRVKKPSAVTVGVTEDGRLLYHLAVERKSLGGKVQRTENTIDLTSLLPGPATAITMDSALDYLFVGTKTGHLAVFNLADPAEPKAMETHPIDPDPAAVTVLGLLLGERSLVVGDARGRIRVWCDVEAPQTERGRVFREIHRFPDRPRAAAVVASSHRERGFVTGDALGAVVLRHSTTEKELLELQGEPSPVTWAAVSPKSTAIFAAHENGKVSRWAVRNKHPEVTLGSLFNRVWYEGYLKPDWAWQSSASTDDVEPKLSLFPLMLGTFKGTLFALLIAVPLSILGALYTAQFMHPTLRGWVKPTVEIMAALPSVVLGFIAGLWLAPALEHHVPAILLMFVALPLSCVVVMRVFRLLPGKLRHSHGEKLPVFLLIPTLLLTAWICVLLNGPIGHAVFGGDLSRWVNRTLGWGFEQRNSFIVGIAMGFAVIPIVFTITEDALSNVPRHLSSGSLALGATRWQTAVRVVLPAALPGIFSAVMIGLGRAVGETMIVLMATGNTPTFDWYNPFTGFRTLSATIAVEIPEAPQGGTLYRTLFLSALLLFMATFVINTAAEIVRQRMRRRYAQL